MTGEGGLSASQIQSIVEAALLAADEALTVDRLVRLFARGELAGEDPRAQVRAALEALDAATSGRGFELKRVASGYRLQVRQELSPWVSRLWDEKPPRYTRALLETLALIAYKQPATRGDVEEVRGVTVSPNIMRTLLERGWIREVGHRDVPGRPAMYGTTKAFLDYFDLKSVAELPSLPEIRKLVEPVIVTEVGARHTDGDDGAPDEQAPSAAADGEPAVPEAAADDAAADDAAAEPDERPDAPPRRSADVVVLPVGDSHAND